MGQELNLVPQELSYEHCIGFVPPLIQDFESHNFTSNDDDDRYMGRSMTNTNTLSQK